jgi:hypothetical protein
MRYVTIGWVGLGIMATAYILHPSAETEVHKTPPAQWENYYFDPNKRGCVDSIIHYHYADYTPGQVYPSSEMIAQRIDRDVRVICYGQDPKLWE